MATLINNTNFLPIVGFKFGIKKLPTTNYFVQSVNIPGVELGLAPVDTPFIRFNLPGDHLKYRELTVTFRVDEDMKNYLEIYDWIIQLGFPDNFNQYKQISNKNATSGEGVTSDGTLIVQNSARVPNMEITYIDMFPRSLSDVVLDSRDSSIQYAEATATFKFRKFEIKHL
jgi:hypothetical protein